MSGANCHRIPRLLHPTTTTRTRLPTDWKNNFTVVGSDPTPVRGDNEGSESGRTGELYRRTHSE